MPPESYEWVRFPTTGRVQFWRRHLTDGSHLIATKGTRGFDWQRRGPHRIRGQWEVHQKGNAPTWMQAKTQADNAAMIHARRPTREQLRTRRPPEPGGDPSA